VLLSVHAVFATHTHTHTHTYIYIYGSITYSIIIQTQETSLIEGHLSLRGEHSKRRDRHAQMVGDRLVEGANWLCAANQQRLRLVAVRIEDEHGDWFRWFLKSTRAWKFRRERERVREEGRRGKKREKRFRRGAGTKQLEGGRRSKHVSEDSSACECTRK
jgi:hypothetical protein